MKLYIFIAAVLLIAWAVPGWCVMKNVDLKSVDITGSFWTELQKRNREVSIPHQYDMLRDSRRLEALSGLWNGKKVLTREEKEIAKQTGQPHIFWDSDVAKWLESAAYALAKKPDDLLERQADEIIKGIEKTQRPDGYINSYFTYIEPENRFRNLRWRHELYCAGHLMEAAVAYYEATGKDKLLKCICRYADYIDSVFGPEEGKMHGYPGHEEIELALVRLYRCTGNAKYLELADYFLTVRGTQPHYWDYEAVSDAEFNKSYVNTPLNTYHYAQAHMPVREQREALGHAVRAQYLYSGMTDVGKDKNDSALLEASRAIWKDVTEKKQYITGGVGSDPSTEGFSAEPYFLPNIKAYCEACASIAFIFWTQRLLNTEPEAVYADKIETTLYNAVMAAMSEDGSKYFYVNPLESTGAHHRSGWFGCSCCPPNIARLYADIGEYIYSEDDRDIYIHQYIGSKAHIGDTLISQETDYPFEDRVRINITGAEARVWFRIPSWCKAPRVVVNGKEVKVKPNKNGYSSIDHSGETEVLLTLPMEVVFNTADKRIVNNRGCVAVTCGPLVYCMEETDNGSLDDLTILKEGAFKTDKALFDKYPVIKARGVDHSGGKASQVDLTLIPYFLWDNREPGAMKVWIPDIYKEPDILGRNTKTVAAANARKKGEWAEYASWCTSLKPGSSVEFLQEGSEFQIHWLGYSDAGLLEVFVDDVSVGVIDEYFPENHTVLSQSFSVPGEGTHKVRLVVREGKNPESNGNYVNFVKATGE